MIAIIQEYQSNWFDVVDAEAELIRRLNEAESLKCCGNCKHYKIVTCARTVDEERMLANEACDHWQSDNMSKQERMK